MSQQTSQDSVNGNTPSAGYLTLGIILCIALIWTTIWLAASLLGGCTPAPAVTYDDKTSAQQIQQDQQRLDALLITLIKQQNH